VRLAVIGHVEWVEFVRVDRVPLPGDIVTAQEMWEEAGGGGAVSAVQLLKLAGECTFFTALGDDALGHLAYDELRERGLRVEAAFRAEQQRRAFTFVDAHGERTITVLGDKLVPAASDPLPWGELDGYDAVLFIAGDPECARLARGARVLTATSRALEWLRSAAVELDALVGSSRDPSEAYAPGDLDPAPRAVVRTAGAAGGTWETSYGSHGTYAAAPLPGPVRDTYGAGDSFVAGVTYRLADGRPLEEALELGARCGAAELTGRGAYEAQLAGPL
jgi:ribokinase